MVATASFTAMATVRVNTLRTKLNSATGLKGGPSTYLSNQACTPLYPLNAELQQRLALNTPLELLQTFMYGTADIVETDVIYVVSGDSKYNGKRYSIKYVEDWHGLTDTLKLIVLEELKS